MEQLTGRIVTTLAAAQAATAALRATMRPGACVLVTSLRVADTPADAIDLLAQDDTGCWRLRTPLLQSTANGAGDTIAALFLLHRLRSGTTAKALEEAASAVFGLLRQTAEAGSRELLMVAAQDEFVTPTQRFAAQAC